MTYAVLRVEKNEAMKTVREIVQALLPMSSITAMHYGCADHTEPFALLDTDAASTARNMSFSMLDLRTRRTEVCLLDDARRINALDVALI